MYNQKIDEFNFDEFNQTENKRDLDEALPMRSNNIREYSSYNDDDDFFLSSGNFNRLDLDQALADLDPQSPNLDNIELGVQPQTQPQIQSCPSLEKHKTIVVSQLVPSTSPEYHGASPYSILPHCIQPLIQPQSQPQPPPVEQRVSDICPEQIPEIPEILNVQPSQVQPRVPTISEETKKPPKRRKKWRGEKDVSQWYEGVVTKKDKKWPDAAYTILKSMPTGTRLTSVQIAREVIRRGLRRLNGITPWLSCGTQIGQEILNPGSRFIRTSRGVFTLSGDHQDDTTEPRNVVGKKRKRDIPMENMDDEEIQKKRRKLQIEEEQTKIKEFGKTLGFHSIQFKLISSDVNI